MAMEVALGISAWYSKEEGGDDMDRGQLDQGGASMSSSHGKDKVAMARWQRWQCLLELVVMGIIVCGCRMA